MTQFGRRQARLLNDPEYFAAFRFVQSLNLGELPPTAENRARFLKSTAAMEAAEHRLFPAGRAFDRASGPDPGSAFEPGAFGHDGPGASRPWRPGTQGPAARRTRVSVGRPRQRDHGSHDWLERGRVTAVRFLRNEPALDAAAEKAVRQWIFVPTLVDGRPVSVLHTVSLSAR